jgi:ubiquinone/menaquinone biosynthesis C-methylase UbiE
MKKVSFLHDNYLKNKGFTMLKELKFSTKTLFLKLFSAKAKSALKNAPTTPDWLDLKELEHLKNQYPVKLKWKKSKQDMEPLATIPDRTDANKVLNAIGEKNKKRNFLELGCQHGMTSYALSLEGHNTTAIDIDSDQFSELAKNAGVNFYKMDASNLTFEDESFDCVFSYNAFEHMDKPDLALKEATRVVKKGGHIYLYFNPLYMSPWGLHSWMELAIPYCQMLFPPDMIRSVVEAQHLWYCNGWSCQAYRELWKKFSSQLSILKYKENVNPFHLNMIVKYPSCFKSKTDCFDDLVVDGIEVLFQKNDR